MAETTETKKRTYKKKTTAATTETKETATPEAVVTAEVEAAKEVPAVQPTVNMVVEQKAPPVKILYIDSAYDGNEVPLPKGRRFYNNLRHPNVYDVPIDEFRGEFMVPQVMRFIDKRKFIILSGLTDDERRQYNCYYEEGEVIKDGGTFDFFFSLDVKDAVEIFKKLCPEHKALVKTRFINAYFGDGINQNFRKDNRITRERVEALNAASKSVDPEGMFTLIVKDINEKI